MKTLKRHKQNTKTFDEMTFSEQAKSISATIINLERAIKAHRRKATEVGHDESEASAKTIKQINRLATRLNKPGSGLKRPA